MPEIEPLRPEFFTGDDVVLRITEPVTVATDPKARNAAGGDKADRRDYRWAIAYWDGGRWDPLRDRGGNLIFTVDQQVQEIRVRRLPRAGRYKAAVWNAHTLPDERPIPDNFADPDPAADVEFVVGNRPTERVQLTKQLDVPTSKLGGQYATYSGFEKFLKDRGVEPVFGAFGPASYDQLKHLAIEYAASCECNGVDDLIPEGYEQNRRDAEPFLPDAEKKRPGSLLPCVELIWNYWEEEGMLVQTLNHILARFQNRRVAPQVDPLARFDISPLLPIRNILWGFAEDETNRLTVRRRAAEYEYEYGLKLIGRAIPAARIIVERRSGFLEAFHTILHQAHVFYKEFDDLTVKADAFPLYQSLRECHLILSQGSHNQYGEMAVAARAEMLLMQHVLAQPPMREFLGGRPMTPYPEPWMDRVDSMKGIQGWVDTSIMHFHDLATIGERLVLTIRLGNWAGPNIGANEAETWVIAFRPMIQKYVAAYRVVTGVDLARGVDATMPADLIARRLAGQRRRA